MTQKELYGGKYLLAAFKMLPAKGEDFKGLATEVAAESSTGSNMRVSTATSFSDDLNARVYKIDPRKKMAFIAYPTEIFDRGANIQNIMTYIAGNVYGMSTLSGLKLMDVWFPPSMLKEHDGPAYTLKDLKKYLGIGNRPVLGTIVKPKIGLKPKEFAQVCYEFWMGGGDFVKFDEPQADQVFAPFKEVIREVTKVMKKVKKETGLNKVFSINISAADMDTMIARAKFVRKTMRPESYAFLVDGCTAGWTALQTIRRHFPKVFLHFHRAGHGAYTRPENPFGYTVPILTKFGRLAGSSGIHTGTAGIGKMKGDSTEDIIAVNSALKKVSDGYFYEQKWGPIKACGPIASGGLNPTKLARLIDAFGTTDFITTMGAGCHSHPDGTRAGAVALVQSCEAWQKKKTIDQYAKNHPELAQAIKKFRK